MCGSDESSAGTCREIWNVQFLPCLHPEDELKIAGGDQEECEESGGKELNLSKNEIIWKGLELCPSMLPQTGRCREPQEWLKHLGIPMRGGLGWIFFFPVCLGTNPQRRERTRILLLLTAGAGVPYRHQSFTVKKPT